MVSAQVVGWCRPRWSDGVEKSSPDKVTLVIDTLDGALAGRLTERPRQAALPAPRRDPRTGTTFAASRGSDLAGERLIAPYGAPGPTGR